MYTILEQVKIRLRQFETQDVILPDGSTQTEIVFTHLEENPVLEQLISDAKKDVATYCQFPYNFSEEKKDKYLDKWENVIVKLVIYDYSKEGAENEKAHSENGVNRTYESREDILNVITPLVTVL